MEGVYWKKLYVLFPNFAWTSQWLTHYRPTMQASGASELLSLRPAIWAQAFTPCSNVEQLQVREGIELTSESLDMISPNATKKASILTKWLQKPWK